MTFPSFRTILIGTILLMITLFSVVSFTVFGLFLKKRSAIHTEQDFNQMNLLRNKYLAAFDQKDGRIIRSLLRDFERENNVLKVYIIDTALKVVYPVNYRSLKSDTLILSHLYGQKKDITIKPYNKEPVPFYRVFFILRNSPSYYSRHDAIQKNMGMIVMDMVNDQTPEINSLTNKFGLFYTSFILAFIFTLVGFFHFKYIKKILHQIRSKIGLINQGQFNTRLDIPEFRELGQLGKDFNDMVDSFEKTQMELQEYHRKELKHNEKMAIIGEMAARIAHEIRNPITGIVRAIDVIISEKQCMSNVPILEEIQRQSNRVNDAISNLLKFSRSTTICLEKGDINANIRSLVFFLKNQSGSKVIQYGLDLSPEVPKINYDHELVENVLMNISCNALQAIPETGTIHFRTSFDSSKKVILVTIKDSGSGVAPHIGNEIFKPFYTTRNKGTGLGLAISKEIIEKHNGELWFENNVDSGCTFFFTLPEVPQWI